jgi:translation machinery-associated protein 16
VERVTFLREIATSSTAPFSIDSLRDLIHGYIHRDDEEIAKFESERRPGRHRSNREDLLKQRIAVEENEYDTGFWIPDMMDATNLGLLKEWTGEWTSLGTMRFVRVPREGDVRPSRFPPKGMS